MRILEVHREADESGVSGTGHVLDAVEFDDGTVVVRWKSDKPSTVIYDSYQDFFNVHIYPHPINQTEVRVLFDSMKWKTEKEIRDELSASMHEVDDDNLKQETRIFFAGRVNAFLWSLRELEGALKRLRESKETSKRIDFPSSIKQCVLCDSPTGRKCCEKHQEYLCLRCHMKRHESKILIVSE